MKKIFFTSILLAFMPFVVFATQLDMSVDKTNITMDDVVHVNITVSGQVDGGQIGVKGLENFTILSRQSSQNVEIINGQTSITQTKELVLQPKKTGKVSLVALARDKGNDISSDVVTITISESKTQKIKDNLINGSRENDEINSDQEQLNKMIKPDETNQNQDNVNNDFDKNLLKPTEVNNQNMEDDKSITKANDDLKLKEIEKFPEIEHVSVFNAYFWIEFFFVLILLLSSIFSIMFLIKKFKK